MIADINKVADFSSKVNSYSHEAKVNKWLAEQNSLMPNQQLSADYLADSRRRRPRGGVDPALLDWKKLTDPKWAELIKEQASRGNLQHDLQKRMPSSTNTTSSSSNSKKGPGRPPLLASPTGSTPVSTATSLPSSLQFPNLSTAGLSGLNSNLLSSLSLGQFDPKNNPLLMPFGGMSNLSALNSMGGLGNLGNMNLFANLAGLGIPGLGMDGANLNENASTGSSSSNSSKNKNRTKPSDSHSAKPPVSSSSNTLPTTSPFPFFFPNPSLLYTPLGLGGLNPFSLQPGMNPAYDTLAQQCGLLNGALGVSSASQTSTSNRTGKSSTSASSRATTTVTSANTVPSSSTSSKHRSSSNRDVGSLQQLLLPHDAHLLESISRVAGAYDPKRKDDKKEIKNKALESLSKFGLPPDYTTDKLKSKREFDKLPADLTKFMEIPGSSKRRDQEMKEALEQFNKQSVELLARSLSEEKPSNKRPRESPKETPENLIKEDESHPPKKLKETPIPETPSIESGGVDIEALLTPSTVVKGPLIVETEEKSASELGSTEDLASEKPSQSSISPASKEDSSVDGGESSSKKGANRRTRGKRKSGEIDMDVPVIERKNLRSSAGRAAAAAAARAEAERRQQKEAEKAAAAAEKDKETSVDS